MTIKKRGFFKLLSIFLVALLLFVNPSVMWVFGQETYTITAVDNTVDPNVEYSPISNIPCRTNNNKMNSAPVLSEAGEGVKGSYAMQIGTMQTTSNTVYFQASTTAAFAKDTEYTIEMKIRKKQGSVDSLKIGIFGYNTTGANYSLEIDDSELSENWQMYTWEHKTKSSSGWKFLEITYTASNGAILLFDEIKVYKADDQDKTPIAFQNGLAADATFDTAVVYEKNYELVDFDNSVDPDIEFKAIDSIPHRTNNENMKSAPIISASGDGVKGSYAMQLGTMQTFSNSVRFQAAGRTEIQHNTEYVIEMKVRIKEGAVKTFSAGIYENGSGSQFSLTLPQAALSNEWQCFRWNHTTNNDSGNWKFFEISYNSPQGVIIQIDDIKIYKADDEKKTPIAFQNGMDTYATFDTERIVFTTEKVDNTVDKDVKYVPAKFYNWENVTVTSVTNQFPSGYIFKNDNRNQVRPRLSALDEGVKGGYAMIIGGQNVKVTDQYQVRFSFPASNIVQPNTEYVFKVKLKKAQGTVDSFKIGFIESGNNAHYSLDILDSELATEWTEYTWKYTTDDSCSGDTVWSYIAISYTASSAQGATIYLDDLIIYPSQYGKDSPIFSQGSFDYKDLGQEEIVFTQKNPTDSKPVFRKSTASDKNGGPVPRVVECNAHTGNYALALGFGDVAANSAYTVSLLPTKPGGTYRISFWVKACGEIDSAYIGFMDSFQKYKYYGGNYSFNQYEQGKWTKVEFVYKDTATISTAKGYRYFMATLTAPAGSGILIDDVSITDVSLGSKAPNVLEFGGFEKVKKELPKVVWSDRYTYKEEK